MKRFFGYAVILGLAFLMPVTVEAQKKDKKPKTDDGTAKASAQEYGQINQQKELVGKLSFADASIKTISIKIESQHYEPNPNFKPGNFAGGGNPGKNPQAEMMRAYQKIMYDQQRATQMQNPQQRTQALNRVKQEMQQFMMKYNQQQAKLYAQGDKGAKNPNDKNNPYIVVTTAKEFDLEVQENAVARRLNLPVDYDDKGNLKQYSKEELATLRGKDASKPGYTAKYEDLAVGQVVKLYLVAGKPVKKEDKNDPDLAPTKPTVRMVLIQQEAPIPSLNPAKEKKKK